MSNIKYIVFDFDGTLVDTIDISITIYNRIAPEYRCKPILPEDISNLRTKKPQELLKDYGISTFKLLILLLRVRKELRKHLAEIEAVEGIELALREIKNAGYKLGILTSNSKENVRIFLENNKLSNIFDFIYSGRNIFGKEKVIRRMLKKESISKDSILYIGDETRDIEATKKAGIPVVAVSWGLHHSDMLMELNPDHIAHAPKELFECLQQAIKNLKK